jgi:hypothetical protein
MRTFTIFALLLFLRVALSAQALTDAAVQITASVQNSPAQITLQWLGNATTSQYQVFRKYKTSSGWGSALATLSGSTNLYVDNTALVGDNYEYSVVRNASNYVGYGYINAGIDVEPIEYRGKLILIVDSSIMAPIATEINRYISDVEGDGWEVIRHDVLRSASVRHVKDLILADFVRDTTQLSAVFLVGHVPVPYSGNINPDGHGDHLGAWPADVYYGDLDGVWTDMNVNSTTASPPRTQNIPGDGKFDQSVVPGNVELQVGRVDFASMSSFTLTEQQLLKNYLDKDHEYRKGIFVPVRQSVVDDNFGYFGSEAFAASGYKNFAPLVGTSNIVSADYITSMNTNTTSYLWSYGCGGGSYNSASGIGTTANIAASNLQGVFTMLFGSYFGDWDVSNSFLRAPLASGKVLTNVWSGRPHFQFHHMGLGENIGYSLKLTQNNPNNDYFASPTGITGKWIHNALMGDPTLRNAVVAPVATVVATKVGYNCNISWSAASQTNVIGYHVYMKNDSNTHYVRINALPIIGTTYTDNCLLFKGIYTYMVRAIVLENTPSGTYYNLSEGIVDTAYNSSTIRTYASFTGTITGATLKLTNTSINGTAANWNFGNNQTSTQLNPTTSFTANGLFNVALVSWNGCHSDTAYKLFTVLEVGVKEASVTSHYQLFPNPSNGHIQFSSSQSDETDIVIYDVQGQRVFIERGVIGEKSLDLGQLQKGLYFVCLNSEKGTEVKKLLIE